MTNGPWMAALVLVVSLLLTSSANGERKLLAAAPVGAPAGAAAKAPAPAPATAAAPAPGGALAVGGGQGQATITSVLSAQAGTFTNATHLFLAGVNPSVAWVLMDGITGGRATDRVPVSNFTSRDFIRNGSWLNTPDAVVHATNKSSDNDTTLVLALSAPVYNASAKTLTFTVAPKAAGAAPRLAGGAAANALSSSGDVRVPATGLLLTDVTMFIDDTSPAPEDSKGTKASFAPLTGQLVDQTPRNQGTSNFASTNNGGGGGGGGGGLINAGSARFGPGWWYPGWGGWGWGGALG